MSTNRLVFYSYKELNSRRMGSCSKLFDVIKGQRGWYQILSLKRLITLEETRRKVLLRKQKGLKRRTLIRWNIPEQKMTRCRTLPRDLPG